MSTFTANLKITAKTIRFLYISQTTPKEITNNHVLSTFGTIKNQIVQLLPLLDSTK